MQKITPFLWFDGNALEAARFYTGIFPDARISGEMPGEGGKPMVVAFELAGQKFTALNGGPQFTFNESVSFVIGCAGQDEIDFYWNALTADGGKESRCGWLKDRFGLSWQVVPENMGALLRTPAAMQAMMGMNKIIIADLEAAAQ
ncbi:MAG: VOC family protein [Chitinophagaceae bacterium]|nr:MAG: VOC family protein [Chitinophagaceae bacterium]